MYVKIVFALGFSVLASNSGDLAGFNTSNWLLNIFIFNFVN